ncbi:Stk1 family PASTA domain-containing Ser/Thr kinase [Gordonia sp. (in: high G+C Gram-positive bacteria)]|uniref:Stk1 family PASTA domain-containing Ser/Thr kinase n=1 Tax=Gordonia sp. (in: high G+C Gram-positive bacteria) TaxID=84139 RepID=UPI001690D28F|nr:Stk1 family PASTA domain-containing Ser/Thr kinase [Gordonia sp. (in: high G+C Gram-positive bacteria)]NLG47759.1 Stk1 family PASTA domain-containing Ser/Thr kinase [Gordonia sp. (in: high G+C Gram-positive bacteria)]
MNDPHYLSERYELGETLGFGGMSEVQFARDLLLHRDVAIKILRPDLARDPMFYLRFRREAQNAAKLNHPTIVQVFDTGEAETDEGPLPFIVMEYVEGDTLRDILRASGHIAQKQAMTWMADVAAAMDFSHRNAIVHRDMKPANVMIDRAGAVKVMDFGIARAMDDTSATMTQTSAVMGTAQYLSPEQARGIKVDPRSDIYSMGCVLFELVTGEPPFTGDSPIAVAHQHVHEDPRRPSSIRPEITPELDSVIMQAMSKNPANRYQTAADFRADLIKVLAGGKPSAPMLLTDEEQTAYIDAPQLAVRNESLPSRRRARSEDGETEVESGGGLFRRRGVRVGIALLGILILLIGLFSWSPWSSSAPLIAVPKVAGLAADAAKANLEQAGFAVKQTDESSAEIAKGLATRTAPGNDVPTAKGSEVTLYISSGPQRESIPDLRGKSPKDAQKALEVLGFSEIKTQETESTMGLKGKVVRSNPRTGLSAPVNAPVILYIGTGPKEVTLPDLRGRKSDDARKTLDQLKLEMTTIAVDSDLPEGQVVSTSPEPGTSVEIGSIIQVQISRGNMFEVPNLRGKTLEEAQATLEAAGWETNTLNSTPRGVGLNSKDDGKVLSQTPSAGSKLRKDSAISVVVGRASLLPG